ncbi:efflux RND transporter periplasmic adaptor subunit [Acetobacteraceae bacterium ESL0709]|nr:efflux RND transporter periplasmic adaptor subunit [Acetobacteraceae bacterium ESL0697]MDF7678656.1 efflux RND transporter periplasmic adaptor subunit [Acetobacteraceae bacterium ESL0709]
MTTQKPASPPRKKWTWKKSVIFGIIAILLLVWGVTRFASVSSTKNHHRNQPQAVAIAVAHKGDVPVILQLLGTVVPIANVTITPRVNGHILKIYYQEGQHVKAGDELELIDPRPYQATLEQYEGTLAADRAQLARARIDNARYQKLIKQDSTSAMTAKDQEYTVKQLEGQVKFDEANVENAKLNVYYCHILAPVDGRVGIRALDLGNYVTPGQSGGLTTLTQMQPISVIFTLPQNNLPEVQDQLDTRKELVVEAWNSDNTRKLATGSVKTLDSQIDTSTGTVRLRGIFANDDERLFPNQFVNAHLLVTTLHDVLLVPGGAVQTGPDGAFLYVVKDDSTITIRSVKTGYSDDQNTVILTALKEGEKVVTDGINHLKEGSKVMVAATQSASAP